VHDLRRTVATGMASLGINQHTISLVLDHISVTKGTVTGAVYVKYSFDREKREALDRWAAHVEQTVRTGSSTLDDSPAKNNHHHISSSVMIERISS
jgi:hypothetical protein